MPNLPAGQNYNVVWKLHGDLNKRKYTLTITYYSNLPPSQHTQIQKRLNKEALQWLVNQGIAPEESKVEIVFYGTLPYDENTPPIENQEELKKTQQIEQTNT